MTQFFDRWWCDFCPQRSGVAPDDPFAQTGQLPVLKLQVPGQVFVSV